MLLILNVPARLMDVLGTFYFNLKNLFGEIMGPFGRPTDVPKTRFLELPFSPSENVEKT